MQLQSAILRTRLRSENLNAGFWWGEARPQRRILIIDDDRALSTLLGFVMRQEGFEVDTVNDSEAGIQLAVGSEYDAVVLDLRMPGKDGRTVFREIRASGVQTPVLILSAFNARQATEELGAEAYLNKPFEPHELAQAVHRLVNREL